MPQDLLKSLWSERPTTPLYHYTSPAGLLGIVESKSLWASGIQYLSDTTEYKHAASIVRDLLTRRLENASDPRNDLYRLLLRGDSIYPEATVFVSSLSEAKDRLSQLRGYCPTGGGFSIGFDPELLERQAMKQDFYLLKCEYNRQSEGLFARSSSWTAAVRQRKRSGAPLLRKDRVRRRSKQPGFGLVS